MSQDESNEKFDVEGFVKKVLMTIPPMVKASNRLPKEGDDYEFYRTYESFGQFIGSSSSQILATIGTLLKNQGLKESFSKAASLGEIDVEELTDSLIACNDGILERAMTTLEHLNNGGKDDAKTLPSTEPVVEQASRPAIVSSWNKTDRFGKEKKYKLYHKSAIERPQIHFKEKIDNSCAPFIPKIFVKPNALRPLSKTLKEINLKQGKNNDPSLAISNLISSARHARPVDHEIYEHPYQTEIENFQPQECQLSKTDPIMYKPLETLAVNEVVDKVEDLRTVLEELKEAKEIAIDLEHHSYRSFLGITCLMQISTREKDYIVDTLKLREELYILNEVFTDPKIIKVLHGSGQDVMWLQRDHGLYLVNMFDTGEAARALEIGRSLKFLLQRYCNVEANKEHQTADWRVRPLDEELINYAQSDTHYLLYIHDVMKNELLATGPEGYQVLKSVFNRSKELCLQRFEKPQNIGDRLQRMLDKYHRNKRNPSRQMNRQQWAAVKALFSWRDSIARREDEGCQYVLPNHMMVQMAVTLPRDPQGVLALCNPVPPFVRQHQLEIHGLIVDAVENPDVVEKSFSEMIDQSDAGGVAADSGDDYADLMTCPHDLSKEKLIDVATFHPVVVADKPKAKCMLFGTDASVTTNVKTAKKSGQDQRQKLERINCNTWNPFKLYMPVGKTTNNQDKKSCGDSAMETEGNNGDEQLDELEPPSLECMLTGSFTWRISKPKEKVKELLPPAPKTFGTVVHIDPIHRVSTAQQSQMIDDLIKSNRNKTTATPQKPAPVEQHETSLVDMRKHEKDLGAFGGNAQLGGAGSGGKKRQRGKKRRSGNKNNDEGPKKTFVPHQYQKTDFRRFQGKNQKY